MSPQDNSDDSLSIYADWLEDNGHYEQSEEVRDGILAEKTTSSALYLPTNGDGWCVGFRWSSAIIGNVGTRIISNGGVGAGYGAGYGAGSGGDSNITDAAVGVEYPRNNNFVW